MCQLLINLVDILKKIFINIVNSVCEHHESVIFVIYDPKNIHVNILHDIFLIYAEKTPKISILAAILNKLAFKGSDEVIGQKFQRIRTQHPKWP